VSTPVEVTGVRITNPDRVLFRDEGEADGGITKRELAEYVARIAPRLLPHVESRPLSLVRCPQGQEGACFYQKHWTTALPTGIETVQVREESGDREPYVVVRSAQGLVSLVQYGVLEMHPWGARAERLEHPDRAVFDLDPAPDLPWERVVATAKRLRAILRGCGLSSWVKTTGGKGLHVVVPVAPTISWGDLHDFVRLATTRLIAGDPSGLVDTASKAARTGKIFVDYLRNGRGATAIAPWSPRAWPHAPVAVPVSWSALDRLTAADLVHVPTIATWLRTQRSDPWAALLASNQEITEAVMSSLMDPDHPPPQALRRPPSRPAARRTR
jgi:bifunctional non-homologous end joining protein LigD